MSGQSPRRTSSSHVPKSSESNSATARRYFSMPHSQKSKSMSLVPSWIEAHSVQPYLLIRPHSRARAVSAGETRPAYSLTSRARSSGDPLASLQTLPISKNGSLLPEYS